MKLDLVLALILALFLASMALTNCGSASLLMSSDVVQCVLNDSGINDSAAYYGMDWPFMTIDNCGHLPAKGDLMDARHAKVLIAKVDANGCWIGFATTSDPSVAVTSHTKHYDGFTDPESGNYIPPSNYTSYTLNDKVKGYVFAIDQNGNATFLVNNAWTPTAPKGIKTIFFC